jgi:GNAT superfamily N-acetyltransferase
MKILSIARATMAEFDEIRRDIEAFWGSEDKTLWTEERKQRILSLHHAMYVHEFGDTSYVIKDSDRVAAYLFGFLVESRRLAYSSLVGVRDGYKNQGLGERLYKTFAAYAHAESGDRVGQRSFNSLPHAPAWYENARRGPAEWRTRGGGLCRHR